jgi:hypothetical protein
VLLCIAVIVLAQSVANAVSVPDPAQKGPYVISDSSFVLYDQSPNGAPDFQYRPLPVSVWHLAAQLPWPASVSCDWERYGIDRAYQEPTPTAGQVHPAGDQSAPLQIAACKDGFEKQLAQLADNRYRITDRCPGHFTDCELLSCGGLSALLERTADASEPVQYVVVPFSPADNRKTFESSLNAKAADGFRFLAGVSTAVSRTRFQTLNFLIRIFCRRCRPSDFDDSDGLYPLEREEIYPVAVMEKASPASSYTYRVVEVRGTDKLLKQLPPALADGYRPIWMETYDRGTLVVLDKHNETTFPATAPPYLLLSEKGRDSLEAKVREAATRKYRLVLAVTLGKNHFAYMEAAKSSYDYLFLKMDDAMRPQFEEATAVGYRLRPDVWAKGSIPFLWSTRDLLLFVPPLVLERDVSTVPEYSYRYVDASFHRDITTLINVAREKGYRPVHVPFSHVSAVPHLYDISGEVAAGKQTEPAPEVLMERAVLGVAGTHARPTLSETLATAKRIYVDATSTDETLAPALRAELASWKRFEVVVDLAQTDLIFRTGQRGGTKGGSTETTGVLMDRNGLGLWETTAAHSSSRRMAHAMILEFIRFYDTSVKESR